MINMSKYDAVYKYISEKDPKNSITSFAEIWSHVCETFKIADPDSKVANFYTNLTLDGRFINVGNNYWNIRERVAFDIIKNEAEEIANRNEESSTVEVSTNDDDDESANAENYDD